MKGVGAGEKMRFQIPIQKQLLLSIAAAHGATDLTAYPCSHLLVYASVLRPPPGIATSIAFVTASVVHFASDIGYWPSLALHGAWGLILVKHGQRTAFECALWYICAVHIPLIVRCFLNRRAWNDLLVLLAASLISMVAVPLYLVRNMVFQFGHRLQWVIVCHVFLSLAV